MAQDEIRPAGRPDSRGQINPIRDDRVNGVLKRLHKQADRQLPGLIAFFAGESARRLVFGKPKDEVAIRQVESLYRDKVIPIDKEQGWLIYLLCRSLGARRVVEFGTSFGVSTLYLAAAVRDNGGGVVIGTEREPAKIAAAKENFAEAGLDGFIDLREGDALETLQDCGGEVDFLLVDGWAHLALPVITIMQPQLRKGAMVVCDNVGQFPSAFEPFTAYMRNPENGFASTLLPLRGGTEIAVRL